MKLKVVLLSTWGNPVASNYLKEIASISGFNISVVFEENEKLMENVRRILKQRFSDRSPLFDMEEVTAGKNIPCYSVPSLNGPEALKRLEELEADYFILGGTGIVKKPLLEIPKIGTINCHPGILPRYRGCTCLEWALYEKQAVGATCHFVSEKIDAGDILFKKEMDVLKGESYTDLRLKMFYFQASVLANTLRSLLAGKIKIETFDWEAARYYKTIPEKEMTEVLDQLKLNAST